MPTYIGLQNEESVKGKVRGARWTHTRAATEPLVMLEMHVGKVLGENTTITKSCSSAKRSMRPKLSLIQMIKIFKDHLKSKEEIFCFDIFSLYQRCVKLLR